MPLKALCQYISSNWLLYLVQSVSQSVVGLLVGCCNYTITRCTSIIKLTTRPELPQFDDHKYAAVSESCSVKFNVEYF